MLMNIGMVESKHVFTLGESGQEKEMSLPFIVVKNFNVVCCMVDDPLVDVVLMPSSINILVEGR